MNPIFADGSDMVNWAKADKGAILVNRQDTNSGLFTYRLKSRKITKLSE